jgi:hypothetical protein
MSQNITLLHGKYLPMEEMQIGTTDGRSRDLDDDIVLLCDVRDRGIYESYIVAPKPSGKISFQTTSSAQVRRDAPCESLHGRAAFPSLVLWLSGSRKRTHSLCDVSIVAFYPYATHVLNSIGNSLHPRAIDILRWRELGSRNEPHLHETKVFICNVSNHTEL